MTIHNIKIHKSNWNGELVCRATIMSKNWKYCNDIVYWCDLNKWLSDRYIPDSQKKMCRREWYKLGKTLGISRKELNIKL